jgi:uncharacterized protein with PIN domain
MISGKSIVAAMHRRSFLFSPGLICCQEPVARHWRGHHWQNLDQSFALKRPQSRSFQSHQRFFIETRYGIKLVINT